MDRTFSLQSLALVMQVVFSYRFADLESRSFGFGYTLTYRPNTQYGDMVIEMEGDLFAAAEIKYFAKEGGILGEDTN